MLKRKSNCLLACNKVGQLGEGREPPKREGSGSFRRNQRYWRLTSLAVVHNSCASVGEKKWQTLNWRLILPGLLFWGRHGTDFVFDWCIYYTVILICITSCSRYTNFGSTSLILFFSLTWISCIILI